METILRERSEIEVAQMQFNYLDYEGTSAESRKVCEAREKYGKPTNCHGARQRREPGASAG